MVIHGSPVPTTWRWTEVCGIQESAVPLLVMDGISPRRIHLALTWGMTTLIQPIQGHAGHQEMTVKLTILNTPWQPTSRDRVWSSPILQRTTWLMSDALTSTSLTRETTSTSVQGTYSQTPPCRSSGMAPMLLTWGTPLMDITSQTIS